MDAWTVLVFLLAATAAGPLNAAVYSWAWNSRRLSAWQPTPEGVARRTWADCLPIIGWLRLRRDAPVLGRGFWVRPMLVEIGFGLAIAALWWWEVDRFGLFASQAPGAFDPAPLLSAAIAGFVLHADGRPAASAKVQWGRDRTTSAEDGSFALQLRGGRAQRGPLVAFLVGFQGAVLHEVFPQYVDSGLSPPPVELVLGPPALTLEGEVWDASGAPCAGWRVSLLDGEEASVNRAPPVLVENLVADNDGTVESDEAGRFLLGGLSARDYTVRAFDPETLVQVRSKPVPAGSRVVLHVDEGAFRDQLAGRVVGFDGTPVADARVGLSICLGRSGPAASWWSGDSVATDELGRFRLRDVPRRDVYLSVHGDSVLSTRVELDEGAPDEGHTVEVIRRCRFRVSWAAAQPGDEFAMIDADEALLNVMEVRASSSSTRGTWRLEEGQSPPLSVSEQASAILLLREGKEVARAPVSLTPGELTVIRP